MKQAIISLRSCAFAALSTMIMAGGLVSTAHAQTLAWSGPTTQNPGGTGSGSVSGNSVSLQLNGGTDQNNSYISVSTLATYPELDFTDEDAQGVRISASNLSVVGHASGMHILYFTITNTPATLPYGVSTALSLELRSTGAFSMGWRENYTGTGGWPSRSASTILASEGVSAVRYNGFDLVLTDESYKLVLFTSDNQSLIYQGAFAPQTEWGDLGVNITLQKAQAGASSWATATIGNFQVQAIPEPSTVAALVAGGLVVAARFGRRRAS